MACRASLSTALWQLFSLQLAAQRRRRIPARRHHQRPAEPVPGLRHFYDRSDVAVRKRGTGLAQGPVVGELPPALLPITEHGMGCWSISRAGTRPATTRPARQPPGHPPAMARGCTTVLNCFSYTGGFAVSALMGGCRRSPAWIPSQRRSTLRPPERGRSTRTGSVQSGVCARRRVQTAA